MQTNFGLNTFTGNIDFNQNWGLVDMIQILNFDVSNAHGNLMFIDFSWLESLILVWSISHVINSLSASIVCWLPLQTVWTQIRPDILLGLIWIQTVWHCDGFTEGIFRIGKYKYKKNQPTTKNMQNYLSCKVDLTGVFTTLNCISLQIGVHSWIFLSLFLNQNVCCGYQKNRLNETVLVSTLNTHFNGWIRKKYNFTSHLSLLITGSTQEDPSWHNWKIVDLT